jgi:lipopolysaccharide/colanic/teichoic acid biosynthesis glycosyltransferase
MEGRVVLSDPHREVSGSSSTLHMSKRLFDIVVASVLIVLLSPLFVVTALIVLRTLGRPLLFHQARAGKLSIPFEMSKFRTMTDDRDATGVLLPDADRQTLATRLLRRLRLDELPQLISVLHGHMSFVGPRPLGPETIRRQGLIGQRRSSLAPGMTGWAQVNGNTRLTEEEKFALDLWYIDHRTMKLDIWIVLLTLRTLATGETVDRGNVDMALSAMDQRPRVPIASEGEAP